MSHEISRHDSTSTEDEAETYDIKLKIMVLGESMVGKTSLITRYTNDKFGGRYLCTVGIDFQKKLIEIYDQKISLQIWDTAGQERFRNINKKYFQTSQGFVLCYDITNKESFEKMQYWVEEIKTQANEKIKCILIGTKCDLENREVSLEEGNELAEHFGYKFFETSAKNNINVKETFEELAKSIVENYEGENRSSIKLCKKDTENKKRKQKSCC